MNISRGKIPGGKKFILYGVEGIGKSTLAARFPDPLFIDTEGSTKEMDVNRFERPTSWQMVLSQVQYVIDHPEVCKTLVVDTADWAEKLEIEDLCARMKWDGLESPGYGRGYQYSMEAFGKLLNKLDEVALKGNHVVVTAHAWLRKIELPDELGAYDHWEMKTTKKVAPMLREWADNVLFCNYKTTVVNVDGQGTAKGRNKAQGGRRVIYTAHHPCWDAKNRLGMPEEMEMKWEALEPFIVGAAVDGGRAGQVSGPYGEKSNNHQDPDPVPSPSPAPAGDAYGKLLDLMEAENVSRDQILDVVAKKGYFPKGTPFERLPEAFVEGVLVGAWPQVLAAIRESQKG